MRDLNEAINTFNFLRQHSNKWLTCEVELNKIHTDAAKLSDESQVHEKKNCLFFKNYQSFDDIFLLEEDFNV